jgi:hypothetical protein
MSVIPPRLAATFAARKAQERQNHERAPICAAFVQAMRTELGPVEVTFVSEGDFRKGRPDETEGVVPCLAYFQGKGKR